MALRKASCRPLASLLFALLLIPGSAQATKYAGAFMMDGGGARALAMGSAFVAVADDATATFWNPAGLLDLENRQVVLMHSERFGDLIDRDFISYVQPLDQGNTAFGFSVIRLGIDDIAFTSHIDLDTDGDGTVSDTELFQLLEPEFASQIQFKSDQEFALFASYARLFGSWQVGANLKFVRQAVGDFSSFGVGADLGALRRDWLGHLDVGIKLQDITTTYLSWNTGRNETISPVLVPGASYDFPLENWNLDIEVAGAVEMHFDDRAESADQGKSGNLSYNVFLGIETVLGNRAALRFGSHGGWSPSDLTYGAGLLLGQLRVDYAFAGDVLDIDENTHRVSLGFEF